MREAWDSCTFSAAIDSARKELSRWGIGGRNLIEDPITDDEIIEVARRITDLYKGNSRDFGDLVSQLRGSK